MLGGPQGLPLVTHPTPAWQVSLPVQNRPSSHLVLSVTTLQPKNSLHWSMVQSMPSLHGLPLLLQPTMGSQVSFPVQNRPSLHRKSSGTRWHRFSPSSQLSKVQLMPSSAQPPGP